MGVPAIIQARMSSKRCPGKVLAEVNGQTLLGHLIQRLERSKKLTQIIVATSTDRSDDAVESYCVKNKLTCYRGPLDNVAKRFAAAARHFKLDSFVRVNADSPLMDSCVMDEGIGIFEEGNNEIVTNVFPRSFPKGQSVEIFRTDTFVKGLKEMRDPFDLEHVTPFFYRNANRFRIHNFTSGGDYSKINLCVDTPEDLALLQKILDRMDRPYVEYGWREILKIRSKALAGAGALS